MGKANNMLEVGDPVWFEADAPYDGMSGIYVLDGIEINADFTVSLARREASETAISGWSTAEETAFAAEPAA